MDQTVKEVGNSVWDLVCKKLWIDKEFAKWLAIFGGLSLTSRYLLYKFYYPSLVRYFSPQSGESEVLMRQVTSSKSSTALSHHPGTVQLNKRVSVSQDLPPQVVKRVSVVPLFQKSLYNKDVRWRNSLEHIPFFFILYVCDPSSCYQAASRVVALVNAVLTAYNGFRAMKQLGITVASVQAGPDHSKETDPLSLSLINMNMAYCAWDLIDMLVNDDWSSNAAFLFHHSVVVAGGHVIKKLNRCSEIWVFTYPWSDIPTVMMHASWFARHVVQNLSGLFELFKKKSVRDVNPQIKHHELSQQMELFQKLETPLLGAFALSFFYIRAILFSQVIPVWLYRGYHSQKDWGTWNKLVAGVCVSGILGVGYLWSYKLCLKFYDTIKGATEQETEEEVHVHNQLVEVAENEPAE
ncbi:hypothetical protein RFI_02364 [Reticulomyxa filosa]|uniref:TLC domain-containing protein n=1 Tax=Reticulomyxa filosa TaxID=46433 RepID=X6P9C6_RETFI|nr:hypothetical protein RFI_02364 [Reticulomyxa filosa]|eukprot:ETO34718.1 hypothetical protein RFI_02364 [Reticulomyxa filosa]